MNEHKIDLEAVNAVTPRLAHRPRRSVGVGTALAPSGEMTFDIQDVIPIRESDAYDYGLLESMIQRILGPLVPQQPELESLIAHGANVMRRGPEWDSLRRRLGASPVYARSGHRRRPVALLIPAGETLVVYGLISAGKPAVAGGTDNDWVQALAHLIAQRRPRRIHTGPFNRLVRNKDLAAPLRTILLATGTTVACVEMPTGFTLTDPAGAMIWDLLVQAAHQDWISTLTRLQAGAINDLKNGRLNRGGENPIPGIRQAYTGVGRKRDLEVDLAQLEQVRAIIETAAAEITVEEAADRLAAVGIRMRQPLARGREVPLINQVDDKASAVNRLWQYLPTYLTGKYEYHQRNTVPGLQSMLGVPIHRTDISDLGEFVFELDFPMPDGGWHDPQLIRAGIERRLSPLKSKASRPGTREQVKPLSGLPSWVEGDHEYRIIVDDDAYTLRRRPAPQQFDRGHRGMRKYEGDLLVRVQAGQLHRVIAELLKQAARQSETDIPCSGDDGADLDYLRTEAARHDQLARRQRELAAEVDADESDAYVAQATEHSSMARSLRAQVAEAERALPLAVPGLLADPTQILAVAAMLEKTPNLSSLEVHNAVRTLLSEVRISGQPGNPLATVSIRCGIWTNRGMVALGPVTGQITNGARRRRPKQSGPPTQRNIAIVSMLADPATAEVIRAAAGLGPRAERRRQIEVMAALLPTREAACVLADCPIPIVKQLVLSEALVANGHLPLPSVDGIDRRWAQEVTSTYMSPEWDWRYDTWARGDLTLGRQVVGWIGRHHAGPNGVAIAEVKAKLRLTDAEFYALLNDDPDLYVKAAYGVVPALVPTAPWPKRRPMPAGQVRMVRLPKCGFCGTCTVPHLLNVPELREGWLCSECRRPPGADVVFPEAYLRHWVGRTGSRPSGLTTAEVRVPVGTRERRVVVPPRSGRASRR